MQSALGRLLHNAGRSHEGLELAKDSLEAMRPLVPNDDLHLCFAELCVGQCLVGIGDPAGGERHLRVALDIAARAQGQGRMMWAICQDSLAASMASQKRWSEFEQLMIQTLSSYRQLFGDEHVYTQNAMQRLADGYNAQGKPEQARALLQSQDASIPEGASR